MLGFCFCFSPSFLLLCILSLLICFGKFKLNYACLLFAYQFIILHMYVCIIK